MSAFSRRLSCLVAGLSAALTLVAVAWQSWCDRFYGSTSWSWQGGGEPMLALTGPTGSIDHTGTPGRVPIRSINCKEQRASKNPPGKPPLFGITGFIDGDVLTFGNESSDKNPFENHLLIANNQRSARLGKVARL
jgi:hypothetical protein